MVIKAFENCNHYYNKKIFKNPSRLNFIHISKWKTIKQKSVWVEPLGEVAPFDVCMPHIMWLYGSARSLPDLAAFFISPLELLDSPSTSPPVRPSV